jgi:hypothetical protein
MDTYTSTALELVGSGFGFVGAVITGIGLFIGWRRALVRRLQEWRAILRRPVHHQADANLVANASLLAIATALLNVDPEGPVPDQLRALGQNLHAVTESLQNEIRNVGVEVRQVRAEIAALPALTGSDVDARIRGMFDEHERHASAITLHDLSFALLGIAITAAGILLGGWGLIVDLCL